MNDLQEDCKTIQEQLFSLLDASLEPQGEAWVSRHIEKCGDCMKEVEILRKMILMIRQNEEALCPEPEDLFLFANYREDPADGVAAHIKTCLKCQRTAEQCKILPQDQIMPWPLLQKLTGEVHEEESKSSLGDLLRQVYDFVTLNPRMIAAVAVVIVVVVVLWPGAYPKSEIALSSVTWEKPSISLMHPFVETTQRPIPAPIAKERLVVVIVLENLKTPMPRERVNSLYQALKPTGAIKKNFDVIPPSELKTFVEKKKLVTWEVGEVLNKFREESGVAKALVVEILAKGEHYSIRSKFVDVETGKMVKEAVADGLTATDLPTKLTEAANVVIPN